MTEPPEDWQARADGLWDSFDAIGEDEFVARMDELAAERPDGDPVALFERAGARDSAGRTGEAIPLYQQALDNGLAGQLRRRAVIQMASSLRAIGAPERSITLLTAERERGHDELDDAISAVLALALTDAGREREAVAEAVGALAPHLARYQRSMANYARSLVEPDPDAAGE
jgi:Tetratrico peptide repeat